MLDVGRSTRASKWIRPIVQKFNWNLSSVLSMVIHLDLDVDPNPLRLIVNAFVLSPLYCHPCRWTLAFVCKWFYVHFIIIVIWDSISCRVWCQVNHLLTPLCERHHRTLFEKINQKIALAKCEIYCKFARVCSSWMQFDSCIFSQFKNIRVAHLLRSQQYSFLERTWIRFVEGQIVKQQYNSLRTASHFWLHNSYTCSQNMMQWLKLMSKSKIRCSASYVILCHQIAVIHRSRW